MNTIMLFPFLNKINERTLKKVQIFPIFSVFYFRNSFIQILKSSKNNFTECTFLILPKIHQPYAPLISIHIPLARVGIGQTIWREIAICVYTFGNHHHLQN